MSNLLLICFTFLILFVANFSYKKSSKEILNLKSYKKDHKKHTKNNVNFHHKTTKNNSNSSNDSNSFVFIQISDLHISKFKGHLLNLKTFIENELAIISPEFVILTGDITDAKDIKKVYSKQYLEEWEAYQKILTDSNINKKSNFWFDQRGNHDCFDVPNFTHKLNYFSRYSNTKNESFCYDLIKPFGKYTFITLDAWFYY